MAVSRGSNRRIDVLSHPSVAGVLGEGRQAYVAVAASGGPHVTPELYAVHGGRLWFFAAWGTLKSRVLPHRPQASVLVRAGDRSVVVDGTVSAFSPSGSFPSAGEVVRAPGAVARFTVRNAVDLVAFVGDVARRRVGVSPRVLFSVTPERAVVLDGFTVTWPEATGEPADAPAGMSAVVALGHGDRLLTLPARWDADDSVAHVPPALVADLPALVDVAVVVDDYGRPGPAAKSGVMVRGRASVHDDGRLAVDAEHAVLWDGVETGTVRSGGGSIR